MKIIAVALLGLITSPVLSLCQTTEKAAGEAYVVTRMANKFHVDPRPLNAAFSADVFARMLGKTDPGKVFFTQNDISRLSAYRTRVDDEIRRRKTGYLDLFIPLYQRRLQQADSLVNAIGKKPIDFYKVDKLTAAEDTLYPTTLANVQLKMYKKIKADVLDDLADNIPGNFKSYTPVRRMKYTDSILVVLQKRIISSFKRKISNILENPYGLTRYVGNLYCETIASCYDPHTEFFPPTEKENFESELGKQPFQFGFRIKADKSGGVLIDNLQPGSPAYKSGKLNKGDRFISLQWPGHKAVDISDITVHEFGVLLDESNHHPVLFTLKKADGPVVQVSLQKELAAGSDDDNRVKSFILKGASTIGYIYLPAFYEDWVASDDGLNGCANDVGREILKLKKENIQGLILDVRYNGGGSVQEATELAGIFIDAGPVAQVKSRDPKVITLKDVDRGTIYDGPLVIMVNGYSASASELLAGTLQDYNRAVIVGSPTYGKATMQVVLPMDTMVTAANFTQRSTENYLKLTISKLYRINGTSAQFKGVQPDIVLPDILDAFITKEADEHNALRPSVIAANKYYTPYAPLGKQLFAESVRKIIDTSKYFNAVKNFIALAKQKKSARDVSLNLNDALAAMNVVSDEEGVISPGVVSKKFIVQNNSFETARLQADANLNELNEEFSRQVAADAYISIAYEVLSKLKTR
jgi:carboxyl-terminal processing protease